MKTGVIHYHESEFPALLKEIPDPPDLLYFWGDPGLLLTDCVAMVGTRVPTPYGESLALEWAEKLSAGGLTVVSGLAYGIDACAHRGALKAGGKTIAVVAQGISELQPTSHRNLAEKIVDSGGLIISERAPGSVSYKSDYLVRNRLISGLSRGVVVVEAAARSGALNTANHALEQGRDVMAVPGRLTDLKSQGTLRLLREGAALVGSAEEVAEIMDIKLGAKKMLFELSAFEQDLLLLLKEDAQAAAQLAEIYPQQIGELYQALASLELKGVIRRSGDQRYALSGGVAF